MATTYPWLRGLFGVTGSIASHTWWDMSPISAGVFGVPLGFAVIIVVSLFTRPPTAEAQALADFVRYPRLPSTASDPGPNTK
jgi:cation/acetate symporter